jgi:hypothetical protein
MAILNKANIGYVIQMPDGTLDEMRIKLNALIRAVSEEINYTQMKISSATPIIGEFPAGVQDGVNTDFVLKDKFVVNSTSVFVNGVRLMRDRYIEFPDRTIKLETPPVAQDVISVDYLK